MVFLSFFFQNITNYHDSKINCYQVKNYKIREKIITFSPLSSLSYYITMKTPKLKYKKLNKRRLNKSNRAQSLFFFFFSSIQYIKYLKEKEMKLNKRCKLYNQMNEFIQFQYHLINQIDSSLSCFL